MDIDLRQAILSNISNNSKEELKATIQDAIQKGEEKMLPGLGVLFELIWKQADTDDQDQMIDVLEQSVQETTS